MAYVNLIDIVWPVESLYFTTSTTNPATTFGGTWTCLQKAFVPEACATRTEGKGNVKYSGTTVEEYNADTINGVVIAAGSTAGETKIWGGDDKYHDIIKTSFCLGDTLNTLYSNSLGLKSFASIHAMGGSLNNRRFASLFNDDTKALSLYDAYTWYGYSQFFGVNTLNIPTRTRSYIWKRIA